MTPPQQQQQPPPPPQQQQQQQPQPQPQPQPQQQPQPQPQPQPQTPPPPPPPPAPPPARRRQWGQQRQQQQQQQQQLTWEDREPLWHRQCAKLQEGCAQQIQIHPAKLRSQRHPERTGHCSRSPSWKRTTARACKVNFAPSYGWLISAHCCSILLLVCSCRMCDDTVWLCLNHVRCEWEPFTLELHVCMAFHTKQCSCETLVYEHIAPTADQDEWKPVALLTALATGELSPSSTAVKQSQE